MTGATSGFLAWFQSWGSVIVYVAQIAFWAAVGFAAVYAALAYRRFVDHKTGSAMSPAAPAGPTVKIDEFVE